MGTIKEVSERVDNLSAICRKEGAESKRKEIFLKAGKYAMTDGRKPKHRSIDARSEDVQKWFLRRKEIR